MGMLKQKFRSIKKFPDWFWFLPAKLVQLLLHTCYRIEIKDPNNYIDYLTGIVTVTWHNRLMFFAPIMPKRARIRTLAVISASRDGQYIADFIAQFGVKSLRGSSSKKGMNALLGAMRTIQSNKIVSFTPDGPRGPKYQMKTGPIHLASVNHTSVLPISVNASSYWQLKSWDGFQIPRPFCKLTLVLADKIDIPADLDEAGLEFYRQKVEQALMEITRD